MAVAKDAEEDKSGSRNSQGVQSLTRGLSVICAFDADHTEMTLSEVARRTGLTRATARRLLLTLVELGYVKTDERLFALTARVLELGFSYLSSLTLPEIAQPHLELLSKTIHESTSASVLEGKDIVYIARVPTRRIMSVGISVGTRFPAYATSMGRVILGGLPLSELGAWLETLSLTSLTSHTITSRVALADELTRVKQQGWALVDQELEPGLRSIAVPVRQKSGAIIAAINISTTSNNHSVESMLDNLLPSLLLAAEQIAIDLAATRPFSNAESWQ